ncbi:MAG TPA: hypothetical protein VN829_07875 [Dongiaceae bacterium]|nr:hypothetical protein [Dongiaceae bacterium]
MKKLIVVLLLGAATASHAGVRFNIGIGLPLPAVGVVIGQAPRVYVAPAPACYPAPAPVYAVPPACYTAPAPVYIAPPSVVVAPGPVYYGPYRYGPALRYAPGWHGYRSGGWRR